MKHFLYLIVVAAIAVGCKKEPTEDKMTMDFVKGEVAIGIDSTVQLEQLFTYINSFNFSINEITGYTFTTTMPEESIPYIKEILNSRPYIFTGQFSASVWAHYQTGIVYNSSILWDMTVANQKDYIQTKNALRMTDVQSATKNMLVKVPFGQEIYWRDKLSNHSWVTWTDLNWIRGFVPFER